MLLAAGEGRRMLPLTLTLPKPLIPVLGRPLAVQLLRRLRRLGVTEAVLNLHHLPQVIQQELGDGSRQGLPAIAYTHEEQILGTAGGIRNAAPLLRGEGTIVLANCDILLDIDLGAALRAHRRSRALATLVLAPARPGYSTVEVDDGGAILSLAGAPQVAPERVAGRYLFTGLHLVEEELLDRIPPGAQCIVRELYQDLAARGELAAYVHEGFWWEFGSPALYLEGSLLLLEGSRETLRRISDDHDPVRRIDGATAAVGPGAFWHDSESFAGGVALGFACHISEGARIEDSVVMPEAWIGPGCSLRRSIVASGVELPAGMAAEQALICQDPSPEVALPPGTRRLQGLLVHSFGASAR
jgi:NDP-sugar pyrophosphorylase family protein